MGVVLRPNGKRVRKNDMDEEAVFAAIDELSSVNLMIMAAAMTVDGRIGLIADAAVDRIMERFTLEEIRSAFMRSSESDSGYEESLLRSIVQFEVGRIPACILEGRKIEGVRNRDYSPTRLGQMVAQAGEREVRRRLSAPKSEVSQRLDLYGLGTTREVRLVPTLGKARLRKGCYVIARTMADEDLILWSGQAGGRVLTWRNVTNRIGSSALSDFTKAMGACLVEFPDGVHTASYADEPLEHLQFPMFLWVAGSDLVRDDPGTGVTQFTRITETWSGNERITIVRDGEGPEVILDELERRPR